MATVEAPLAKLRDRVMDTAHAASLPSQNGLVDTRSLNIFAALYFSTRHLWVDVLPTDDSWHESSDEEDYVSTHHAWPCPTLLACGLSDGQDTSRQECKTVEPKRVSVSPEDSSHSDILTNHHPLGPRQKLVQQIRQASSWMNVLGVGVESDESGRAARVEMTRPGVKRPRSLERRGNSQSDEDEDDDEKDTRGNRDLKGTTPNCQEDTQYTWACPYAKLDTVKYFSCVTLKLSRIVDVRQHLKRRHMVSDNYCPKCGVVFSTREAMESHVRSWSCEPTSFHHEGVTRDQWEQIAVAADRKRRTSEAERWYTIWDILFSHLPRPNSPFANDLYDEKLQHGLKTYLRGEGRSIIFNTLDSNFPDGDPSARGAQLETIAATVIDNLISGLTAHVGKAPDTSSSSPVANLVDMAPSRLPLDTLEAVEPLSFQLPDPWIAHSRSSARGSENAGNFHIPHKTLDQHQILMMDLRPPRPDDVPHENMTEYINFSLHPSLPTQGDLEQQIESDPQSLLAIAPKRPEQSDLKVHTCSVCGRDFVNRRDWNRHVSTVHSNIDAAGFHCACGYNCGRKDNFRRHIGICTKTKQVQPYRCSCRVEFTDKDNIIHHLSTCGKGGSGRPRKII